VAYQQVTWAQLRTMLQARVESSAFWSDTEALHAINEALRLWNLLTGMWKRRELITTVADQVYYSLTSTLVYSVRADFSTFPLEQDSLGSLDNGMPGWEGHTTATSGKPTRPAIWAPVGLKAIAIWPADHTGGNEIAIDGVRQTPVLSADTDYIDIGQAELQAILSYGLHYLAFKEGGQRFAATQKQYKEFILAAAEQNGRLKASTFFRRVMGLDQNRGFRPMRIGEPESRRPSSGE